MKACNRKILELFYNAKHTGRISKPDAVARVGEDDEGLVIELTWRVLGGVIADAKFRAFANPNAIAITSLMVDNIIGKTIEEALSLGEEVITDNLGEFLPEYLEAYDMVCSCIEECYNNYVKRQNRKTDEVEDFDYEEYLATHPVEEGEEIDILQIQRELYGQAKVERRGRPRKPVDPNAVVEVGEKRGRGRPRKERPEVDETVEVVKRGRGRPRKEIDPNLVVEVGEKRGRGRPRKPVDPNAIVEVGEKRGRGRPRKIVDETAVVEIGEKRGRGRPRKEIDPNQVIEVGEKRGRGRPRKEIDPSLVVEVGEKRGRGRPRKIVDETTVVEIGEKRGRGRPRKEIDPNQVIEVGEKRGRGRPRKEVDPNLVVEVGEKRGRGRPKKEIKYNFPTDLDEVIDDEEIEQLINGDAQTKQDYSEEVNQDKQELNTSLLDEDDDMFEANYDLFKSNIRNILSGKESNNKEYNQTTVANKVEQVKTVENTTNSNQSNNIIVEDDEVIIENNSNETNANNQGKVKIEVQEQEELPRTQERPATPASSLTRSLSPSGMASHGTQDIVFASKNVTTTNININVTKTTTSVEDNKATSDDYSHNTTITQQKVEVSLPVNKTDKDEEIEIEPTKLNTTNSFEDFDDDDEEVDDANIKDEAPTGGIEDLLKALLDD